MVELSFINIFGAPFLPRKPLWMLTYQVYILAEFSHEENSSNRAISNAISCLKTFLLLLNNHKVLKQTPTEVTLL